MRRYKPAPMQEAMLFETQGELERYITTLRYALNAPAESEALARRLKLLVERHEILRTRFIRDDEGVLWLETDESDAGHFRVTLTGQRELTVEFNHVMLDGWSVSVLVGELVAEGEPSGSASPYRYYSKWLERRDTAGDLLFWKNYLGGSGNCPELPNKVSTDGYERRELRFAIENTQLLRDTARKMKITASRLIQAVWSMLIARYNGGESIVCTVNAGRGIPVPGVMGMAGLCVNTLPVLTRLPKPPESVSFADWAVQWSGQTVEAEKHGFCSLGSLISGRLPHILSVDPSFSGAGYTLLSSSAELVTDFDTAFTLGDTITAEFAYNVCAYSEEAAKAVKCHFLTALNAVLENPNIPLELIPILTETEISELTAPNEDAEMLALIGRKTVIDLLYESAGQHASKTALVCDKTRLTYSELLEKVRKLAAVLQAHGVGAETPVAILLPRSERYVITELAVLAAGGFFVPLDIDWPEHRIRTILGETAPKLVITETVYCEFISRENQLPANIASMPHGAAYMIMTSGTTGTPNGVVIEHRALTNFCLWAKARYGWIPGDSCAMELGFAFDGSLWSVFPPLISGGALHILPEDIRFDLGALGNYCRAERITHIDLPVTLAEAFREIFCGENTLPNLRVMVTGGEEVRRVAPAPYPLSNEYGPTECTVCCSAGWVDEHDSPITVGSPPPNMNAYILDEWGRLCPDGVVGEAYFSGVQIARGYYNAPELTAERFIKNSFDNYGVMYKTGDLMVRNQCRKLIFKGRVDNQVKLSGFRVELAEIESVLLSHDAVQAAGAFVRDGRLCAYVVPKGTLQESELRELLRAKLPSFMQTAVIIADSIPLNSSGKVDINKLPLPDMPETGKICAPVTENEKKLVSVTARLLDIKDIGTNSNYLELGGNSINAMRISYLLEKEGFKLAAKELITSITLGSAAARMVPVKADEISGFDSTVFTPLHAQLAMMFLNETAGSDMYAITVRFYAEGLVQEELDRRFNRAVVLHDILRTSFETDEHGHVYGRVSRNGDTPAVSCSLAGGELTLRYHHIALDGHSVNMLIRELLYGEFPDTAPSFAVFANRLASQNKRLSEDAVWWRDNCRNAKTIPLLPPKTVKKPEYKRVTFCTAELLRKCTETARTMRVTPAAFALTAWSAAVDALGGGGGGILVPFVASCRDDDRLMGMCAAAMPLVYKPDGKSFSELARHVQETMLESVSHWFTPQDIISKLPEYLFVFEDGGASFTAEGEQNYDLVIKISNTAELIYNADRLRDDIVKRYAGCLETALRAGIENRVSAMSDAEYTLVTDIYAHGRAVDSAFQTAADAFVAAAHTYGEHVALETRSGHLTYAELYRQAAETASRLNAAGLGDGDIATFSLPRTGEAIIAVLGIALSGAAFLPLDPAWPEDRTSDILSDSGAAAVISAGLEIRLTGARKKVPPDTAYVIYTSGTTGRPKGVVVPKAALANQIAWAIDEFDISHNDKLLHYITFTFDPSVWVIFTALCSGAALSLVPEDTRLDPEACARHITERGITRCTLPAAVAPDILSRAESPALRTVFLGGEAVKNLPARDFEAVNCYGPTETCINAAFYRLKPGETDTSVIGSPVAGTSCYVLDTAGSPCLIGVQGELYIGGVQLASGYLDRPEENTAFLLHPIFGRLYKTGDSAVWNADGTLTFLGRGDRQVKVRGHRVELSELEYALNGLDGVADAKVIYRDGALDAYIIAPGKVDTAVLKKQLPSYMLPRSVTVLDAFPLTENGKIDLHALPPPETQSGTSGTDAEPLTETETAVADAWRAALGLAPDFVISRCDDFFELGGHSLLLFHIIGLLSASGITVDIKTLIEHPELAGLAEAITRHEVKHAPKPSLAGTSGADVYERRKREMEGVDLTEKRVFRNILITGGTGFLGSHLIREFYEHTGTVIHLPVRDDTEKLGKVLRYYFGTAGTEMAQSGRLRIYLSDISQNPPDITDQLDAIYHTAADIRHYAPEHEMYSANVTATEHMLSLAGENTLFAHVSTTSAVNSPEIRETDTDPGPEFDNIYQRTKQFAEQHVFRAGEGGLKYAVFRVGHVSPGFENGSVPRNSEINAMLRLINAMLLTELLPERDYKIGYGYVDKAARALRLLSTPVKLAGQVFHIDNPNTMRLSEIFKLAGLKGTVLPKDELTARLAELSNSQDAAVRYAAGEYLGRLTQGSLEKESSDVVAGEVYMDITLRLLERLGFRWPHMTGEYILNVIRSLRKKGGMLR